MNLRPPIDGRFYARRAARASASHRDEPLGPSEASDSRVWLCSFYLFFHMIERIEIRIIATEANQRGDLFGRLMSDLFLALGYDNVRLNIARSGRRSISKPSIGSSYVVPWQSVRRWMVKLVAPK
jgi:hypothetical protein